MDKGELRFLVPTFNPDYGRAFLINGVGTELWAEVVTSNCRDDLDGLEYADVQILVCARRFDTSADWVGHITRHDVCMVVGQLHGPGAAVSVKGKRDFASVVRMSRPSGIHTECGMVYRCEVRQCSS